MKSIRISGLALSILYPTMVLLIQQIYPSSVVATRTGTIGYRLSFMILPAYI